MDKFFFILFLFCLLNFNSLHTEIKRRQSERKEEEIISLYLSPRVIFLLSRIKLQLFTVVFLGAVKKIRKYTREYKSDYKNCLVLNVYYIFMLFFVCYVFWLLCFFIKLDGLRLICCFCGINFHVLNHY